VHASHFKHALIRQIESARMPAFSCLIHTRNHERTLGRALETIHCADEIVVIDHGSTDATLVVAKEYGAKVATPPDHRSANSCCRFDWILALRPNESLHEALEASLFEWKTSDPHAGESFSVVVREQISRHWYDRPAETRLLNRRYLEGRAYSRRR
jgi:glycosyltransferase involved in cell wall biosynthesis